MQKSAVWLMVLLMILLPLGAYAEEATASAETWLMAGYDSASVGHDWNNNFFFQRREAQSGVRFTFRQFTDLEEWTQEKARMTANGELPDVLFKAELTPAETRHMYEQGILIDLKPYLEEYAPNLTALLREHPEWKEAITLPGGEIVALPSINELQNNNAIWINTTWLKRVGMEMPTTAEELTEVLRAFKNKDANMNGNTGDEIPLTFTGMWDLRFLGHAFGLYSNDYHIQSKDGVVTQTLTSDRNRAFLTWLNQLWTENLIDHNGFTASDTTRAISSDDATITYGVVFGPSVMSMLPSSAVSDYALMMPLTCEGEQVYRDFLGDVVRGAFAITTACEDPAALVSWVDYLYSEEGYMLASAGLLDAEYEVHSDGTWNWIADTATVAQTILPEYTIAEGGNAPMYLPLSYQLNFDDDVTHAAVVALAALKEKSVTPYPLVYLTDDQQARVDAIWSSLGPWSENMLARFVTGDVPLDDENWQRFCETTLEMGIEDMVSIWQEALR